MSAVVTAVVASPALAAVGPGWRCGSGSAVLRAQGREGECHGGDDCEEREFCFHIGWIRQRLC